MSAKNTKISFQYFPLDSAFETLNELSLAVGIDVDVLHSVVLTDFFILVNTAIAGLHSEPEDKRLSLAVSSFLTHYAKRFDEFDKLRKSNEES